MGHFWNKNNRKYINVERDRKDKNREQNNLKDSHSKRFNAKQGFEKRRIDRLQDEEKKDAAPAVIAPEICTFKAAVMDPSQLVQSYIEKEVIQVSEIFEKSRTGFIPIGPETGYQAKSNQDAYMTIKTYCGVPGLSFIGVFDGHGYNGQKVSKFIKRRLPKNIRIKFAVENPSYIDKLKKNRVNDVRIIQTLNNRRSNSSYHQEESKDKSNIFEKMGKSGNFKRKIIEESFYQTHSDLRRQNFDIEYSGTTAVICIVSPGGVVTCANIGDSRAIILSEYQGTWTTMALSEDHKPENPEEYSRILKYGGRVEAYKDEYGGDFGPKRVWLKNENLPGLVMSRSFGDLWACRAGVIQSPEFIEHKLTNKDKAIVLASDGVWEFLSNEDVMNILIPYLEQNKEQEGELFMKLFII